MALAEFSFRELMELNYKVGYSVQNVSVCVLMLKYSL